MPTLRIFIKYFITCLYFILLFINIESFADGSSFPLMSNLKNSGEYFVGKEEILKNMHEFLFNKKKHHSLVISGSPGTGKTQIITRYAELHKNNYEIIWWFDVNKDLGEQYSHFARKWNKLVNKYYKDTLDQNFLQINLESMEIDKIIDEVHDRLRTTKLNWLIILDHVEDSATTLRDLPKHQPQGYGHIIIATPNDAHHSNVMHLKKLTREESIELLLKTTGENDRDKANTLAKTLNDYPLAVSKAGTFIASHSAIDMEGYNRLFTTKKRELWEAENQFRIQHDKSNDYNNTVFTTLAMPINEIKKESSLAYELLAVVAFLDSDNISENLLIQYFKANHPQSSIDIDFKNALSILMKQSLLSRDYQNQTSNDKSNKELVFTTHEIIQQVMQELLSAEEKISYLNQAIMATNQFSLNSHNLLTDFLDESSDLVLHANSLMKHAYELKLDSSELIKLKLCALEYNLYGASNYKEAERLMIAFENFDQRIDTLDELIKIRFIIIKSVFLAKVKGDYLASLEQAIYANDLNKKLASPYSKESLMIYYRLAKLYSMLGDNQNAFKYIELAKEILDNNSELIKYQKYLFKILIQTYIYTGDYSSALKLSNSHLYILGHKKEILPQDVSMYLTNIDVLIRQGKYKDALNKLDQLSQIDETSSITIKNTYKAHIIFYSSYVRALLGFNLEQVINASLAAQDKLKQVLGKEQYYRNIYVSRSYSLLGELYEKQGDSLKAEELYNTGVEILTNIYSNKNHAATDDLSDLYMKLAIINIKLQRVEEALEYFILHRQIFTSDHHRSKKLAEYFIDNNIDLSF